MTAEQPDYVHTLSSGVEPTENPVILDSATMLVIDHQIREIERSRAAAEVSGRDYLIT